MMEEFQVAEIHLSLVEELPLCQLLFLCLVPTLAVSIAVSINKVSFFLSSSGFVSKERQAPSVFSEDGEMSWREELASGLKHPCTAISQVSRVE